METRLQGLRQFATHILNPVVVKFAGARFSPFAAVCHTGRRSGKEYRTPIVVRKAKGKRGFVLSLPYGSGVDWYRNIVAAEHSSLLWHGREYKLARPTSLDKKVALAMFAPLERFILRRFGIQDFALAPLEAARHVQE